MISLMHLQDDLVCNLINSIIVETVASNYGTTIHTTVIDNKLLAIPYLFDIEKKFAKRLIFLNIKTQDDENIELIKRFERSSSTDIMYVLSASVDKDLKYKCLSYESVTAYIEKPLTIEVFAGIYCNKIAQYQKKL